VVRRHRDLGGADEVHLLALEPVDVVAAALVEVAGALHGAAAYERRGDHLGEAGVAGLVHRHVHQGQLELRADSGEEVEAAATDLGAALEVDRAEDPAELDVVAGLEPLGGEVARRTDLFDHDEVVLATGRRLLGDHIGDRLEGREPFLLGDALGGLELLDLPGELLHLREQGLLLLARGLRDLLAEGLLRRALLLERRDGRTTGGVGGQGPVHHVRGSAPLGLRGANAVGLVTEDARVDHARQAIRPTYGVARRFRDRL
jgi:hypothetical protein